MRHFNDFYPSEKMEIYRDDDDNIIFVIGHLDIFEPQKEIKFKIESIKEIINDLNELIK